MRWVLLAALVIMCAAEIRMQRAVEVLQTLSTAP